MKIKILFSYFLLFLFVLFFVSIAYNFSFFNTNVESCNILENQKFIAEKNISKFSIVREMSLCLKNINRVAECLKVKDTLFQESSM